MGRSSRRIALVIVGWCAAAPGAAQTVQPDPELAPDNLGAAAPVLPERPPAAGERLRLRATSLVCEPFGLGAIDSVPHNFPGASEAELEPLRDSLPSLWETELPAGKNPHVARVFGGDLGSPIEHSDGKLYLIFDDVQLAAGRAVEPVFCDANGVCGPRIVNDDLLASTRQRALPTPETCLNLSIEAQPQAPKEFRPITLNGYYVEGGANLGGGIVPGPGFSTGKYLFMMVPSGRATTCTLRETGNTCPSSGGIEGDHCIPLLGPNQGLCYFGPCGAEPDSPCALRANASTLAVRDSGSKFRSPEIDTHIESAAVLEAYRGHFATASFYADVDFATSEGRVWVVGRDGFWSPDGMPFDPYLLFHPVHAGKLGAPQYYAGVTAQGAPVFSGDRRDAKPIYRETKLIQNHTSIAYLPQLDGGSWVMLYGGRAQLAIRGLIELFVRPVTDRHFYSSDAGVYLRWAKQPWGPWSDAITIFNAVTPGQGGFCESMYFEDPTGKLAFSCPPEAQAKNQRLNRSLAGLAGEYGVNILPRYTRGGDQGCDLELHWLMSTWNPYRVVLMSTRLSVERQRM